MSDHAHIEYILKREYGKLEEEVDDLRAQLAACQRKSEELKRILTEFSNEDNWETWVDIVSGEVRDYDWISKDKNPIELARQALED